jgi:hypothetical protein
MVIIDFAHIPDFLVDLAADQIGADTTTTMMEGTPTTR